jgi:hypothetical protein
MYTTQAVATTLLGSTVLTGAPALTADAPVLNLSQTWSNIAVTFTGIKYNTTNTNSAAASLLMDLQVDTVSKFHITKNGSAHGTLIGSSTATFGISATTGIGFYSSNRVSVLADGQVAMFFGSSQNIIANGRSLSFESGASGAGDTFITRKAAANLRFGAADAAAPFAQTLSVQSVVTGTSNIAGQNLTLTGSQGTGTGAGGSLIFQVAPAGSASTFTVTFTNGSATINGTGLPTTAGTAVAFTTTGALPTNFAINTTYFILAGSTSTDITVAATAGGTAIVAGSAGSGTQTLTQALAQNALVDALTVTSDRQFILSGTSNAKASISAVAGGTANGIGFNGGEVTIVRSNAVHTIFNSTSVQMQLANGYFEAPNSGSYRFSSDTILSRKALRNFQFGAADAAAPFAQTLSVQSVVGGTTGNIAGQNFTINGSQGVGSGAGGSIIFQVAPAGTLGATTQNALAAALTIASDKGATFAATIAVASTATFSGTVVAQGSVNFLSGSTFVRAVAGSADGCLLLRNDASTGFDRIQLGGTSSSFPALKRSTTSLQARLADDTAFTNIQGKLTTDTAYTAGALVATGYITIYDSTGTAYRVPCLV